MARDTDVPEDELFRTEPDRFLEVRGELAQAARAAGDAEAARRVAAVRKPTLAAWIVNRHVLCEPDEVGRLLDLGARLRDAHGELDVDTLRELTAERRAVIDELTRAALAGAGRSDPSATLREDVAATFDAAVADPEVAGRLGRLQRAEHWSGFGVAAGDVPATAPVLRLVTGGADTTSKRPSRTAKAPAAEPEPKPDLAARRKLMAARKAVESAEAAAAEAEAQELEARKRAKQLADQLTELQRELDAARAEVEAARRAAKAARARQREARSALIRAERS